MKKTEPKIIGFGLQNKQKIIFLI